jgi:aspartyl-tRNA synthetase
MIIENKKCIIGEQATIRGWVHRLRDHGGLTFMDIRDYGGTSDIMQCVFTNYAGDVDYRNINDESVVEITGLVSARPEGTDNPKLSTGKMELVVSNIKVHSHSSVLPFKVAAEDYSPNLEQRLTWRFLDLRRDENQKILKLRSDLMQYVRTHMHTSGFMEVQTPILTASSPEGARDFLVPARLHPGEFYALPQAPQIFKQLLMASGVQKYFQIAPCFRDESGRSDRTPGEFYQIDMEMAWATQQDVFDVSGKLVHDIFEKFLPDAWIEKWDSWPQIPYNESMEKFGNDKPDLRVSPSMYMQDITDIAKDSEAAFLHEIIRKGGVVKAIPVYFTETWSSKIWKEMDSWSKEIGMPGLGYLKTSAEHSGPMAKFFTNDQIEALYSRFEQPTSDYKEKALVFIAGKQSETTKWGSALRVELAKRSNNFNEKDYEFCWIVDYPMFELNEDTGKIEFSHNPFSMPQNSEMGLKLFDVDPLTIKAHQYDLVLNGVELSSGSVRNFKPELMLKAFEIAGYAEDVVKSKFPALWNAFHYGTPPHAGIAPGFDRILMFLTGSENIRDVIAFPMNNQARDLLLGAPNKPTMEQLRELNIKITK